jgi:uncharacterized protein (DUF1778 family)
MPEVFHGDVWSKKQGNPIESSEGVFYPPLGYDSLEKRVFLRLPPAVMEAVEQMTAHLGQLVGEFAISALAHTAREVIEHRGLTVLTARDWERFLALLDEPAEPNAALKAAAERYKQQLE